MSSDSNHHKNIVSGGVVGGFFNGGNHGTVIVTSQAPDHPSQFYNARIITKLPRQGTLALLTSLITVFAFVTGWNSFAPVVEAVRSIRGGLLPEDPVGALPIPWLLGFGISIVLLAMLGAGLHRVRAQTFQPPHLSLFPALAGITDAHGIKRLALIRLKGMCRICGGSLRFYNKPIEWHFEDVNGRRKRIVDRREPAAECKKNPKHWYTLEITDRLV